MRECAHLILQCVLVSFRPLVVEELAEFLAFDFEAGPLPKFETSCRPEDLEYVLLATCPGLLTIIEAKGSRIVQFSHPSVKQFLMSGRLRNKTCRSSHYHIDMTHAHTMVTRASLSVLLSLDSDVSKDNLRNTPLNAYACRHWLDHASFDNVSQHIQAAVEPLLDPTRPHFEIWMSMYNPDGCLPHDSDSKSFSEIGGTALHYGAAHNLVDLTKFLAGAPWHDIDVTDTLHRETALMVASEKGHVETVQVLLASGANTDAPDRRGRTALHRASEKGHFEVVLLLLARIVCADRQDTNWETALQLAKRGGHIEVAQLLLKHSERAFGPGKGAPGQLRWASQEGRLEVARLLLKHGVDANTTDDISQTPLHIASREGHADIAQLLLEYGANAKARDINMKTPLHVASEAGRLNITQLLLKRHICVDATDRNGWTPLDWAHKNGHDEVVQILRKHGAMASTFGLPPFLLSLQR
jgi:ankyrin repeat protein